MALVRTEQIHEQLATAKRRSGIALRLIERIGLARPRAAAAPPPALTGLDMASALEIIAAMAGKTAPRAHLVAALPLANGDLAPKFATFALARVGLAGRWMRLPLRWLGASDLPVVAMLDAGGAVVLCARPDADRLLVRDAGGEHAVAIAAL